MHTKCSSALGWGKALLHALPLYFPALIPQSIISPMSQRCIPPDPCLHRVPAERPAAHMARATCQLGQPGFVPAFDTWVCSSMSVPWDADPMQRTSSKTGRASIASCHHSRHSSLHANSHTQGLQAIAGNAFPYLTSDLLTLNSNKKMVFFQSPSWSHLTQGAGLCSTVCPLLLPVFTRLQGDTRLLAPLQERPGLTVRWANTSCVNVFLQFPCS